MIDKIKKRISKIYNSMRCNSGKKVMEDERIAAIQLCNGDKSILMKAIEDENWRVRVAAVENCNGDKDILLKAIEDEDRDVRISAVKNCMKAVKDKDILTKKVTRQCDTKINNEKPCKTEILKVKGDWEEVVDDCRSTVGKEQLGHTPSAKFKQHILLAEHSPIRDISIKWRWKDIPHWVGVHWVRHKWECFVRTQRSDRTGVDRTKLPQDAPQTFVGEANCQHLIDTMRKRLCFQASTETREYAEDLKLKITEIEPELGNVLVPNCIYRCGCPEMSGCGYFSHLCEIDKRCRSTDIQDRYDGYNTMFKKLIKGGCHCNERIL